MTSLDLRRTSIHEASHHTVAAALGVANGIASVRPSPIARSFGVSAHGSVGMPRNVTIDDIDKPYPLINAPLKRAIEKDILIAVAGDEGVALYAPIREAGFYQEAPCVPAAAELAGTLLSVKEADDLERFETGAPTASDEQIAHRLAHAAVGEELMARYLSLMKAMAAQILTGTRQRRQVLALADALEADLVLSAKRVRDLLVDEE